MRVGQVSLSERGEHDSGHEATRARGEVSMSELDSIERIAEDLTSLCDAYQKRERYPFSGIYQLFDDSIAHRIFLMMFVKIIQRVEELPESE